MSWSNPVKFQFSWAGMLTMFQLGLDDQQASGFYLNVQCNIPQITIPAVWPWIRASNSVAKRFRCLSTRFAGHPNAPGLLSFIDSATRMNKRSAVRLCSAQSTCCSLVENFFARGRKAMKSLTIWLWIREIFLFWSISQSCGPRLVGTLSTWLLEVLQLPRWHETVVIIKY